LTTRSRTETVTFNHPVRLAGLDRLLPPGAYEVVIDEEMIEGLSFPCYRRVATMMMVPAEGQGRSAVEMITLTSRDLADAQSADAIATRDGGTAPS
jgi:hypothetical protein